MYSIFGLTKIFSKLPLHSQTHFMILLFKAHVEIWCSELCKIAEQDLQTQMNDIWQRCSDRRKFTQHYMRKKDLDVYKHSECVFLIFTCHTFSTEAIAFANNYALQADAIDVLTKFISMEFWAWTPANTKNACSSPKGFCKVQLLFQSCTGSLHLPSAEVMRKSALGLDHCAEHAKLTWVTFWSQSMHCHSFWNAYSVCKDSSFCVVSNLPHAINHLWRRLQARPRN